ncbi:uncharacterized protein LOC133328373 [Musca vetustissima]|uniref:uncharacterized protein LOC133328373 n=1 Tax=Musca vetustissima TaxID=27455 RepID=UPI002AB64423|nr:uncharacterized protein LOC133328373 [Musca vetustissima]
MGVDPHLMENLRRIVSTCSLRERQVIIAFDEMEVRKELEFNKADDVVDGYQDFGGGCRNGAIASKALVFMVKGCCSNWKYIMSFYASSNAVHADQLKSLLLENIDAATDIGLIVRGIVCDQGSSNLRLNREICTESDHFFIYKDAKIVFLWDFPHLFKSLRINLFSKGFKVDGYSINKEPIVAVYEHDKKNFNVKLCPKLTERHVYLSSWDKMNVARAIQVFSRTVAAAIDTLISNGKLNESAKPTSEFLKKINDIFDELNVKSLHTSNPNNKPIHKGCNAKIERLKNALEYVQKIETTNMVKCVNGLAQTIRGMVLLSEEVFDSCNDVNYVLTGKLSQDALENAFSRFRAQGNNSHPSVHKSIITPDNVAKKNSGLDTLECKKDRFI